ncbi:hypothetical protein GGQ77_002830 [Geobacillus thermodenitrificans]|uniref:hypothetical protein n=1 Tax=Geobacillus thermodenitrificans TaxID=33940 RepID=UPI002DFE5461|nr:hypothetical protein [Geobacillus thermodenitrificans]
MNEEIKDIIERASYFNKKYSVYKTENQEHFIYYFILINCLSEIILSKKYFKRNKDLLTFLDKKFDIKLPDYLESNRSLILGRTVKYIAQIDDIIKIRKYLSIIYKFFSDDFNNKSDTSDWSSVIDMLNLKG